MSHILVRSVRMCSASKAVDAELEEALDLESPIAFLGPAAQGLR